MEQFVGIDVSKAQLDIVLSTQRRPLRVTNDATGWARLIARLAPTTAPCIVLEPTSTYHVGVVLALAEAGMPASLVNPRWARAFAESEGTLAKTDRVDAGVLARYAAQRQPAPTAVPSAALRELRELLTCRDGLVQMRVMALNRLETATAATAAIHRTVTAQLAVQQAEVEARIAAVLAADADLGDREQQLRTAPGVGPVVGPVLVAELPELGLLDGKALAALAGVAPHPHESGRQRGPRRTRGGRRPVTRALYQMALTAVRWDPAMGAHYRQLRERGKPPTVALIAVARRMLGILTAMVRDGLTWQQTRVGQGAFLPQAA